MPPKLPVFPQSWTKAEPMLDAEKWEYANGNSIALASQDNKHFVLTVDTEFQADQPLQYKFTGTHEQAYKHAVCLATKIDVLRMHDQWSPKTLQKNGFKTLKAFAEDRYIRCLNQYQLNDLMPIR